MAAAFDGKVVWYAFLLKILFTCLTLETGFKGGEIVPSFFIGATMGCVLSGILGLPANLGAACGMCGVFCAITNSPFTSMICDGVIRSERNGIFLYSDFSQFHALGLLQCVLVTEIYVLEDGDEAD